VIEISDGEYQPRALQPASQDARVLSQPRSRSSDLRRAAPAAERRRLPEAPLLRQATRFL